MAGRWEKGSSQWPFTGPLVSLVWGLPSELSTELIWGDVQE